MPSRRRSTETGAPLARTFSSQECARSAESAGRQIPPGNGEGRVRGGSLIGASSLDFVDIVAARSSHCKATQGAGTCARLGRGPIQMLMNTPGTYTCLVFRRQHRVVSVRSHANHLSQVLFRTELQLLTWWMFIFSKKCSQLQICNQYLVLPWCLFKYSL